jgi:bacteriocin biosynthesis cyclodehydratase domain-containing protein
VIFDYGDDVVLCEGTNADAVVTHLLDRLDGEHTVDEILAGFDESARELVCKTLESFAQHELLTSGPPVSAHAQPDVAHAAHFMAATQPRGMSVTHDAQILAALHVGVIGGASVAAHVLGLVAGFGRSSQLSWNPTDDELSAVDLIVVAPSPTERPRMKTWNERAIESDTTWLQILPYDGSFAAVGPLYIPGETCCYHCFAHRRAANAASSAALFWSMQETPAMFPQLAALDSILAGLATLAVMRWHSRRDASLPGSFQSIEINRDISVSSHVVYRVPRCEVCATSVAVAPPAPWFEGLPR